MTESPVPLIDVFLELQRRNFQLSVQEYLNTLDALARGFGNGSRQELIFLCQTLWAKSPEEQSQIAEALQAVLPKELTERELQSLMKVLEDAVGESDRYGTDKRKESEGSGSSGAEEPDRPVEESGDLDPDRHKTSNPNTTINFVRGLAPTDINIPIPAIQTRPISRRLDFAGQLPVTKRQLKRAWRYYRRMQRIGQPVELDVTATIERMYQQGIYLDPVLIPRRSNLAQMLMLVDEGGSMIPFRPITQALLESARQSGLARVSTYFFHNVVINLLFSDSKLNSPRPLDNVLAEFIGDGALVISDAGAARGNSDMHRVEQTKRFIQMVRRFTSNIAWLNPTPESRWRGTTAEAIRDECAVAMFTFDRIGVNAAVDVLRGRGR